MPKMPKQNLNCELPNLLAQLLEQNNKLIEQNNHLIQINNEQNAQLNELLIHLDGGNDDEDASPKSKSLDD